MTLAPEEILDDLLGRDPGLRLERYYGERSVFYNPDRAAPLGRIVYSIKDRDGPNDRTSDLSRPGVFRFAFALGEDAYAERFGPPPRRPDKGRRLELRGHDPAALDVLCPHPVYAWMRWVQILAPSRRTYGGLRPLLEESLDAARAQWTRKAG